MWVCKVFGHKFRQSPFSLWISDQIRYVCIRPGCEKIAKTVEETWWINRNKGE